jgi:hypothetical protein
LLRGKFRFAAYSGVLKSTFSTPDKLFGVVEGLFCPFTDFQPGATVQKSSYARATVKES